MKSEQEIKEISLIRKFRRSFTLTYPIEDEEYGIACSGGADSVMAVLMLSRHWKKKVTILHFNHGTEHCDAAEEFVKRKYQEEFPTYFGSLSRKRSSRESKQSFWREERLRFLSEWSSSFKRKVILAHNLSDVQETWLKTSFVGHPSIIPNEYQSSDPQDGILIRPFLAIEKNDIKKLLLDLREDWFECPSNEDTSYERNYIRHVISPAVKGLYGRGFNTTVRNMVLKKYS